MDSGIQALLVGIACACATYFLTKSQARDVAQVKAASTDGTLTTSTAELHRRVTVLEGREVEYAKLRGTVAGLESDVRNVCESVDRLVSKFDRYFESGRYDTHHNTAPPAAQTPLTLENLLALFDGVQQARMAKAMGGKN